MSTIFGARYLQRWPDAFEGGDYAETIRRLPHKIIPGEVARYRQSILVERAIVGERLRLAIGLPVRDLSEYTSTATRLKRARWPRSIMSPP